MATWLRRFRVVLAGPNILLNQGPKLARQLAFYGFIEYLGVNILLAVNGGEFRRVSKRLVILSCQYSMQRENSMAMKVRLHQAMAILIVAAQIVFSQAPHRVDPKYEDTLRVVLLWNNAVGLCSDTPWVGAQTRDFILRALDTTRIRNVRVRASALFVDSASHSPSVVRYSPNVDSVKALWGSGRLPHVVVHSNAGWGGFDGPEIDSILDWALASGIGVVEIGDDAALLAVRSFGFNIVDNFPQPMGNATWLNQPSDSLWMTTTPSRDTLCDSTVYPFLKGIVRPSSALLPNDRAFFLTYLNPTGNTHRCEADPDAYTILPSERKKITLLAYQQGYNASPDGGMPNGQFGSVDQFTTIAAFRDTTGALGNRVLRQAVSLSFQPQYLENASAAQQLVYDAIMFASVYPSPSGTTSTAFPNRPTCRGLHGVDRPVLELVSAAGSMHLVCRVSTRGTFDLRGRLQNSPIPFAN